MLTYETPYMCGKLIGFPGAESGEQDGRGKGGGGRGGMLKKVMICDYNVQVCHVHLRLDSALGKGLCIIANVTKKYRW